MHATEALVEADRLMTICNSCRYCEGLCAVFPAMEKRREFSAVDLKYLSNLCHDCGACYDDCQFTAPHEFQVNVPRTLARVRAESYADYAWPPALSAVFARNGLVVGIAAAAGVAIFVLGFLALGEPAALDGAKARPGAFYRLMPHGAMVAVFGTALLLPVFALALSLRRFWRDIAGPAGSLGDSAAIWQAMKDAGRLRYLDGGGDGCADAEAGPSDRRRVFHHLTVAGFALCFAATSVATVYHYVLGREAPYALYDLPVVLGIVGGIGLLIGPAGLLASKAHRRAELRNERQVGMDVAFIVMLFLTSLTGLALLALRSTAAMEIALAVHLGVVAALFVTLPYGKFVHGLYRFAALVRYAQENRRTRPHG